MTLIFNIRPDDLLRRTFEVSLVGPEAPEIAASYQNCRVALGYSERPGVWDAVGRATLIGCWTQQGTTHVILANPEMLAEPVRIQTVSGANLDSSAPPHGMDTLDPGDAERISGLDSDFFIESTPSLLAAEAPTSDDFRPEIDAWGAGSQNTDNFIHRVERAYKFGCAFTGLTQLAPDRHLYEGVVIEIDGQSGSKRESVNQALYVSRTVGFCYRHGLLAIGEDYDIIRHPELNAQTRMLLEVTNRKALLFLPEEQSDWPDLEAARRHRLHFGY